MSYYYHLTVSRASQTMWVGCYTTRAAAEQAAAELKSGGYWTAAAIQYK